MKVGLIGCGYWGKNLARNFHQSQEFSLVKVADLNPLLHKEIETFYPNLIITKQSDDIILDLSIDLVVIATPVKSHYELVKKALINWKDVLVE
jgi:predicted dehydrogenase